MIDNDVTSPAQDVSSQTVLEGNEPGMPPVYLTLAEAAELFPGRKPGKRLYVNTVWRWCMRGVRRGIRLRSVLIGGQRYTTRQWVQEFITSMNQTPEPETIPPTPIRTPRQRRIASERATEELRAAWKQSRRRSGEGGAQSPS